MSAQTAEQACTRWRMTISINDLETPATTGFLAGHASRDAEVEELKALSVTNIMLTVVPGEDGMGVEVYAKTISDVENAFTALCTKMEDIEAKLTKAEKDRDEWKQQHENLVAVHQADLTALQQKLDVLEAETKLTAAEAEAELAKIYATEPVAWPVTFNGEISGNIYPLEYGAKTVFDRLNSKFPQGLVATIARKSSSNHSSAQTDKWSWMMDYCKQKGIQPAQQWAWNQAEQAYFARPEGEKK